MSGIGRRSAVLAALAALALVVGAVGASAGGGNSANAKLCQKNGWQNLFRADGSPFANQGACVSYGAQGGTPKHAQTVAFTSAAPAGATFGGATYTPAASASSGLPVSLSVDPGSASVCAIAGGAVSFTGVGTCTIDADQAGDDDYLAAPQAQQSFAVAPAPQTVAFTSSAPTDAKVGNGTYTPTATASSGLPVSLSIDAASAGVCAISGGVVSFTGAGTCTVDADQAGNADYLAAPQARQSFDVAPSRAPQTIAFTSAAPTGAAIAGQTYTPVAAASSGLPVTFSIDPSSAPICLISSNTGAINFVGVGTCTVHADQAGDADWLPAPRATQSFQVGIFAPVVTIVDPNGNINSPALPPNPAWFYCDPPTIIGGGCFTGPLDGSTDNVFTAAVTAANDSGFDPSLYVIEFHWQIFKPPGLSSAPYSSNGITGYHASVLDIQPDSLPELLGTDAGPDFYWRVELSVTVNGVTQSGFFKFQYQSSTLSLKLSSICQLTGQSQTLQCQFAAPNGLPATEPT